MENTPSGGPDAPRDTDDGRGRRPGGHPRALLRLLGAAAGVAVLAGIGWLARYQPLAAGNAAEIPGDLAEAFFEGREEVVVDYEHGETYTYAFSVQNTGPLPTTVLEVVVPGAGLLHPEEIRTSPADDPLSLDPDTAVPFEPFRLGVDEERGIVITARFLRCDRYEGGGGARKIGEELSVRTVVLTRTASIRFPRTIRVGSPGDGTGPRPDCPVVGPDVETPTERPSEGPILLEASLLATPEAEVWFTSLEPHPRTGCTARLEGPGPVFEADVGDLGPLDTHRLPAESFRSADEDTFNAFDPRHGPIDVVRLRCSGNGRAETAVGMADYEPPALQGIQQGSFEHRLDRPR